ncbi:hypothetical protein [Mycobacteroides abscessus]|uniref:hypothetical protein n=1 Tax=Mycobacteroides abscessus TaxID=36809 RepID=UPI0009263C34|nr:hypothetical protein [Mycobacteroides abscessus]MDM2401801.1 hypothetical protein [Mycobacteroides abscessus]MDM2411839.1 hypothetical protein [Mycobacteroides abscessus]MDO3237480.1 hypothetical protein [Mycobacteroides abscessus subsp. abscessus]SHQ36786.1 Uncharacterised protein [Mycobacteroides abscessus subsp. abscessus]SHQ39550.1 Uncharacterised protein [Mycobacteroides abscessus subsp. abscessus]
MSLTFDPAPEFDSAMAAFDKAEQACALTAGDVTLRADIAELLEALPMRERQRAWVQAAEDSGTDPRNGWYLFAGAISEAALTDFFTDRDARHSASAVLMEAV